MTAFTTISDYHRSLISGETSCIAAVQHYLQQIGSQQHLNAFNRVYAEEALERAAWLDSRRAAGSPIKKLHGVVAGIKDVLCYNQHLVTASSGMLQNYSPGYNATVVEQLLAEEAIIIGHQNCDEFAMGSSNENSFFGPVLNAADNERVPGGSSGGSAVAVQSGMCMFSLGSDTGGSVRQPADFCGIVGLKPTYGRVSRYGLIAYASSFDQVGILARTVPDAALVLEVIAGKDEYDSTLYSDPVLPYASLLEPNAASMRIGYFAEALNHPSLDNEIRDAIKKELEQLKQAGHTVTEISFSLMNYLVPTYYILTTAEAASNLSRYDGIRYGHRNDVPGQDLISFYKNNRSEGFGAEVKRRIMLGNFVLSAGYYDAYYTKAQQVRRLLFNLAGEVFSNCDVLLMPNSPFTAFKAGEKKNDPLEMYLADIYTVFANLAGLPSISIPLYRHSNGMPFGLQVLAAQRNEAELLRFSASIEAGRTAN